MHRPDALHIALTQVAALTAQVAALTAELAAVREAASAERQKEAQLSEATRRKLQRRAQIIHAEVKSELAKATNSQKSST
jgi:hypothetical protein